MTVRRMLKCGRCIRDVRIDGGMAHHADWPDPFDEHARSDVETHVAVVDELVACAECATYLNIRHGLVSHPPWVTQGEDWEDHEVRGTCPRCGAFLDGPQGIESAGIEYGKYYVAGVAFYVCRCCRGVWHRFTPGRPSRLAVERFFCDQGGPADGSKYRHPIHETSTKSAPPGV